MLPLAPLVFPLTCPVVRPKGVGAVCADADEAATLRRLETQLEVQVIVKKKFLFFFSFFISSFPSLPFLLRFAARRHSQGAGGDGTAGTKDGTR